MVDAPTTVLLVEDDPLQSDLLRGIFRIKAPETTLLTASTLREARTIIESATPDLVIADLRLPDGEGVEIIPSSGEDALFPVIILTARGDEKAAVAAMKTGAADYLVKSSDVMQDMPQVVERSLREWRLRLEARETRKRLDRSLSIFNSIVEKSEDGILVVGTFGEVLYANPVSAVFLGRPLETLVGSLFGRTIAAGCSHDVDVSELDGGPGFAEMKVTETAWAGEPAFLVVFRDISERKRMEQELRRAGDELRAANDRLIDLTTLDPLTDLLNRRGLEIALAEEIERAKRNTSTVVCILIDLDDFKKVNDNYGHAVGDAVLRQVAERLRKSIRRTDRLARIGGDEFMAILPDIRIAEGRLVAEKLRMAVSASTLVAMTEEERMTASLSVVPIPHETSALEELLAINHAALRMSKRSGKNRVTCLESQSSFLQGCDPAAADLGAALYRIESLRTVAQRIFELRHKRVIGLEFLCRGPSGPFEMPVDLFRLARENNALAVLDLNCLRVCVKAAKEHGAGLMCHVNLCPSTLIDTPTDQLVRLFPEDRGDRERFCIELSEQQFVGDPASLKDHVETLRKAGFKIAIDDMGFGRSSVETLILLEPDVVKIDPRYVQGVSADPGKERSLGRLLRVVQELGAEVVAEGIEAEKDADCLLELGVRYGQGFLWGVPS